MNNQDILVALLVVAKLRNKFDGEETAVVASVFNKLRKLASLFHPAMRQLSNGDCAISASNTLDSSVAGGQIIPFIQKFENIINNPPLALVSRSVQETAELKKIIDIGLSIGKKLHGSLDLLVIQERRLLYRARLRPNSFALKEAKDLLTPVKPPQLEVIKVRVQYVDKNKNLLGTDQGTIYCPNWKVLAVAEEYIDQEFDMIVNLDTSKLSFRLATAVDFPDEEE